MAEPAAIVETPLLLKARLFDRAGMEICCIAERERDRAIGLARRADGTAFDPASPFLTLVQIQTLALQVAAGREDATGHPQTPAALACGFLALIAAIQGATYVQASPATP